MQFHSLDINGPILPEALCNLSRLFQQTQHGNFTVYTNSIVSTGSFNAASIKPSSLPPPPSSPICNFNHHLNSKPVSHKSGLKEVSCKNDRYTWNQTPPQLSLWSYSFRLYHKSDFIFLAGRFPCKQQNVSNEWRFLCVHFTALFIVCMQYSSTIQHCNSVLHQRLPPPPVVE